MLCRVPILKRNSTDGSQIRPSQATGCISCASGDGGPIWWDTTFDAEPGNDAAAAPAKPKLSEEEQAVEDRAKRLRGESSSFM